MLLKLAARNMRRSFRDYAIYFVTLLIAVTIFYAFNSVGDQQVMHDIAASGKTNIIEFTGYMMNIFSVIVALVLGFLVIYANQLLISRRKREFGIYLVLGMKPGQVSRILLYETVFVGLGSLVLGLTLGILISQLLSFATAALFGIPMPGYQFSFSPNACIATLACFAAIYVVVAIFNVITVRHCKLIDLMGAKAKEQKIVIRNPWVCLALFVVSIALIAIAYWQLDVNGMVLMFDAEFQRATVFMLVGTLLFFFSLSGFAIAVLTRLRGVYLKRLRPFTTRQVASKFNTSFVSIWVVCVLLFFAITTFATGLGLIDVFTGDIEESNPYDATVLVADHTTSYEGGKAVREPVDADTAQTGAFLRQHVAGWNDLVSQSAQLDIYDLPTITYGEVMDAVDTGLADAMSSESIANSSVQVIGLTQFNDALALAGKPTVTLVDDQYLVTNNMAASEPVAHAIVTQSMPLPTPLGDLAPASHVEQVQLGDFSMASNGLNMVVPDEVVASLASQERPSMVYVNVNYVPGSNADDLFDARVHDANVPGLTNVIARSDMMEQASGMRVMITYLAVYIGLVLLVATAAVLAIQLLSLTIDSLGRYRLLGKLGCDSSMLARSLLEQVLIYFIAPLALAVCHSACAIAVLSESLFSALGVNPLSSIAMAACLVVAIYGGYMLITYLTSRSTVKQAMS
ncbi:MAG: FtsX-like permease family protein [Coriobacteriales bacterium]